MARFEYVGPLDLQTFSADAYPALTGWLLHDGPLGLSDHDALQLSSPEAASVVGRLSSGKRNSRPPRKSTLVRVGHQWRSMCSMTRSVPSKWLTNGAWAGLYMASVISRMRATFSP